MRPSNNINIKLSYHDFSKDKAKDVWAYYKVTGNTNSTELGTEYNVEYKWQYNKVLEFQLIYAYFNVGRAIKEGATRTPINVQSNDAQRLFFTV